LLPAFTKFFKQFTDAQIAEKTQRTVANIGKIVPQIRVLTQRLAEKQFAGLIENLPGILQNASKSIGKIADTVKKLRKDLKDIAVNLPRRDRRFTRRQDASTVQEELLRGIKLGRAAVISETDNLLKEITDRLPKASKGPLVNLFARGVNIAKELAKGLNSTQARKIIEQASARLLSGFSNQTPASLPKFGPLRNAILKAPLLPILWAKSALRGLGAVDELGRRIGQALVESIRGAIETGNLAERAGLAVEQVSLLDTAIQRLGGSAGELNFSFSRIQDTLRKTFTDQERASLQGIGIDLDEVRSAANPVLELFLRVSDALKQFPIGSKQAKQALDLLGVTAQSSLIPILRRGRETITGLIQETNELGVVIDKRFVESARRINSVSVALGQFRQRVINEFVSFVLPALAETAENIVNFVKTNSANILALIRIAGRATSATIQELSRILVFIATSPDKALNILTKTLLSVFDLVTKTASKIFDTIDKETIEFFKVIASVAIDSVVGILTSIFALISNFIKNRVRILVLQAGQAINAPINSLAGKVRSAFLSLLPKNVSEAFKTVIPKDAGEEGAKNLADSFTSAISKIEKESSDATDKILKGLVTGIKQTASTLPQIAEQGRKALGELIDKGTAGKVKKDVKDFAKELGDIFAGTAFGDLGKRLAEQLNLETFRATANEIKQEQQEIARQAGLGDVDEERAAALRELTEARAASLRQQRKDFEELKKKSSDDEKQFQAQIKRAQEVLGVFQGTATTVGTALTDLYELSGRKIKEFAIAAKATSLAQAIINGALGVTAAFTQPVPFPLQIANAALISAATGIQIAKIAATGFAKGGLVTEGTGPQSDDVMARLSRGEFVIPAGVVQSHTAQFFEGLRRGVITPNMTQSLVANNASASLPRPRTPQVPRFQGGGLNTMTSAATEGERPINIVNIMDPAQMSEWQSSAAGQTSFLNVLSQNKTQVQSILAST
jgi:hypothetical protein